MGTFFCLFFTSDNVTWPHFTDISYAFLNPVILLQKMQIYFKSEECFYSSANVFDYSLIQWKHRCCVQVRITTTFKSGILLK